LELALPSKMIQQGSESNANKVLAQEGGIYRCLSTQRRGLRTHVPSSA
jgi:hypothetical protein